MIEMRAVRQVEMGRAALAKSLAGANVKYVGFVREDSMKDIRPALESQVYNHWDQDTSLSPPKVRPRDTAPPLSLSLQVLAMQSGRPKFPTVLFDRFDEGTSWHTEIKKMKEKFDSKYGSAPALPRGDASTPERVSALCDFAIEEGLRPMDISRHARLPCKTIAEFGDTRQGSSARTRTHAHTHTHCC